MSKTKFVPDLFIESQELNNLQDTLLERTTKLQIIQAKSFGLLKNGYNSIGNNWLVEVGTLSGTIKIATKSYAFDADGNFITKQIEDNMSIPDNNSWYWIKIKFQHTSVEEGTVTVAVNGNITGTDTQFTKVLRGLPNKPSKIKLLSSVNTAEYEVVDVVSDTVAIISGSNMTIESGLKYKVVGTFTPGISILENIKYPFQYDGCLLSAELETVSESAPAKIVDKEFYIARVKSDAGVVTVQDKRTEFYVAGGAIEIDTSWKYPILNTGYSIVGIEGEQIKYRKNILGHLEIKGHFICNDISTTRIAFVLPEEYRPVDTIYVNFFYSSLPTSCILNTEGQLYVSLNQDDWNSFDNSFNTIIILD